MVALRSAGRALSSGLLILLLAGSTLAGEDLRILSPEDGAFVAGVTTFRFEPPTGATRVDVYVDGQLVGTATPPDWSFLWMAPESGLAALEIHAIAFEQGDVLAKARSTTTEAVFGETVDVSAVQLYPVVVDWRGRYVEGLRASDLMVLDGGREMAIDHFSEEPASLTVNLLVDVSQSMKGRMQYVKDAGERFLDLLDPEDLVGLKTFHHGHLQLVSPTTDHRAVRTELLGVAPGGGTALYDAVVGTVRQMEEIPGRKALVVFSDGRDERSISTLETAVGTARKSHVLLYAVGAGKSKEDIEARSDLARLAEPTGGRAFFFAKYRELPGIFQQIIEELRAQYVLSYTPPPGEPGERTIEVRTRSGKYDVRCRETYHFEG